MPYKTILVHLNDKRRASAVLGPAIHLARRFNAHLIGMHVYASMPAPPISIAYGAQVLGSIMATERKDAEQIAAVFAQATANQPFVAEWRCLKVPHVDLAGVVMEHGRSADLIIAGQTDPDWDLSPLIDFPERLALESGRPVLVVPYAGRFGDIGRGVMIAWKAGRELARAVFDALPILQSAEEVQHLRDQGACGQGRRTGTRHHHRRIARPTRHQAVRADLGRRRHRCGRRHPLASLRPQRRPPGDGRLRSLAHARARVWRRHPPHRPPHDRAHPVLALTRNRHRVGATGRPAARIPAVTGEDLPT